jgi:zinc protease
MASLEFDRKLYAGHPYARPEDGYIETISAIGRQDLIQFHADNYGPQGMVLSIAGGIDPEEALGKVVKALGSWQDQGKGIKSATPVINPLQSLVREHVQIAGKSQTDIILGCLGPERSSPDFLSASLGNNILGQFGMYGRLGERVREQAGLAYYAYSSLSSGIDTGAWYAAAGVDPMNVEKTIDLILDEISKFVGETVSEDELTDSKANYIGKLPLRMESNAGVANSLTQLERYTLGLDYYQKYADMVKAVTIEDVLGTANKYLDKNRMVIISAGTKNNRE